MKKIKNKSFYLKLRSRHPSTSNLRFGVKIPVKAVYRHGSTTATNDIYEINSVQSVKNSSAKFSMKACFTMKNVKSAEWFVLSQDRLGLEMVESVEFTENQFKKKTKKILLENLAFPLVAKLNLGSRGRGMVKINNIEELKRFLQTKFNNQYYFEQFYSFNREYRLHVSKSGCFYACRKLLRNDIPNENRWYRNDSNCNWILEENPSFDKPTNWNLIISECVKALESVGLDVGACDVRVQSAEKNGKKRSEPDFIIIEINSAPSFGNLTLEKYKENLPRILMSKYELS